MYYHGDGVKQNYQEAALVLWQQAAQKDIPQAQYNLGVVYGQDEVELTQLIIMKRRRNGA